MFNQLLSVTRRSVKTPNILYLHCAGAKFSEHKMMRKIMMVEKKKKHKYNATPLLLPPTNISKGSYEGKRSCNSRRADVLNKLFMRHITDLMSSGDRAEELFGLGIQISRVQVTPDYKEVHVFWICSDVAREQEVENSLNSIAGELRCELAQLHIVGLIPKIVFFKDKNYSKILRIDEILAIADFGEDHEPQQYKSSLKTELKLQMKLDEFTKLKISKLENETMDNDFGEPIPEMPQNVLGLDHAVILNRVKKRLNAAKTSNNSLSQDQMALTQNESPIRFSNLKAQNEAFKEFLIKRKLLEAKAKQENKNYRPDLEYIQQELTSSRNNDGIFDKDLYLDDFIDEEKLI